MITIQRIDHIVFTVRDIEATCAFYKTVLGMEEVTFGQGRKALRFGRQKINLHQRGKEFEPKALSPTVGAADVCFISSTPIEDVLRHLQAHQIKIEQGPVERDGSQAKLRSVYIRDPDGNLIEISNELPSS
jgi:catechol 2,3-dioxygenase-like lactoylglutathione lyase family enzyme